VTPIRLYSRAGWVIRAIPAVPSPFRRLPKGVYLLLGVSCGFTLVLFRRRALGEREDPALRRRATSGLNKGEARHSLARAVFFHRLGEIRDRSFENQRHRASGLNLVVAAITLWNTVYLERATEQMAKSQPFSPALLQHVSPLGWDRINLTGDYSWHVNKRVAYGGCRAALN
jgi:Tn3 transposase DDE domain